MIALERGRRQGGHDHQIGPRTHFWHWNSFCGSNLSWMSFNFARPSVPHVISCTETHFSSRSACARWGGQKAEWSSLSGPNESLPMWLYSVPPRSFPFGASG